MDLSVRLPHDHPKLERYLTPSCYFIISPRDDLIEWLITHAPSLRSIERDQMSGVEYTHEQKDQKCGLTFHFTDLSEALLFKLTWL